LNSLGLESYDSSDQVAIATDLKPSDRDVTTEVWSLDYVNLGTTTVKNALTVPAGGAVASSALSASDIVTSAAPSTSITTVALAYQRPQRLEFATGVMVPFRPYHSYSTAETATAGVVTGNVIQETLTYTAVPLALVNIVVKQGLAKGRPVAGFATIGTGVNAASGSVEFGVGGSFSWRSFMVSFLADIGRDTRLTGGFYPNEPLPISNPPKPLTETYWSVKPAVALSVRIPLGGSSSSH